MDNFPERIKEFTLQDLKLQPYTYTCIHGRTMAESGDDCPDCLKETST